MNEKRNIVAAVIMVIWVGLLVALQICMPVSELMNGMDVPVADTVLSAIFCFIGIASAVIGYFLESKPLILVSAFNAGMLVLSAVLLGVYMFCFNRDVLAIALRLINQFCAMLVTPGFVYISVFAVVSVVLPIVANVLLGKKLNQKK